MSLRDRRGIVGEHRTTKGEQCPAWQLGPHQSRTPGRVGRIGDVQRPTRPVTHPHACSYCGQTRFWGRFRHRDPVAFAAEVAWLHRAHGVEVVNLADENPTASRPAWKAFLEALIAENVSVIIVGSTRAGDIVRDADLLPLYKKAGVARFLLGIENTDPGTLAHVRKGSTSSIDRDAIRLLRKHGILSLATWVVGFTEETDRAFWQGLRQLLVYDPDQVQMIYATPHRWTPYFRQAAERRVIESDQTRWDYKHQVLASKHVPRWRVLAWVKLTEAIMQLRPRSLARVTAHEDLGARAGMRWYYRIGVRVWLHEVRHAAGRRERGVEGLTVRSFWRPRSLALPCTGEAGPGMGTLEGVERRTIESSAVVL